MTMQRVTVTREAALSINRDVYYGHGKLEVVPKILVRSLEDVATVYTPGAGFAVREIVERPGALSELTAKDNMIAVVTDGTAVLGLGAVGPRAAAPVMEGKAVMFKLLAGIDCISLCVAARDAEHLVDIMAALEPNFGGYNLEDVAAPSCFEVMRSVEQRLSVPVLHDDQYGTATVVLAALRNACRVLGRDLGTQRVVVNGAGASATATIDLLQASGVGDVIVHDRTGIICRGGAYASAHLERLAQSTNADAIKGDLSAAVRGAGVFIGLSVAEQLSGEMVRTMAERPIVLALANPVPEIMPEAARDAGAAVVATGRYDYPNQCNNVLGFPGLLRGALDTRATRISRGMCIAAAESIAADVAEEDLSPTNIVPTPFSETLYPAVAEATAAKAVAEGLARIEPAKGGVAENTRRLRALVKLRQEGLAALAPGRAARGRS